MSDDGLQAAVLAAVREERARIDLTLLMRTFMRPIVTPVPKPPEPPPKPEPRTCAMDRCDATWRGRGDFCAMHARGGRRP